MRSPASVVEFLLLDHRVPVIPATELSLEWMPRFAHHLREALTKNNHSTAAARTDLESAAQLGHNQLCVRQIESVELHWACKAGTSDCAGFMSSATFEKRLVGTGAVFLS